MNFSRLKPGRKTALAAIVTGGLLITIVVGLKLSLVITRRRAERLLSEVKALKLGESTASDAQQLVDRYGGWTQQENDSICSGSDCLFFAIPVSNRITESLLRARWLIGHITCVWLNPCCDLLQWRAMGVGIHAEGGKITQIEISLETRRNDGFLLVGRLELVPSLQEVSEPLRPGYSPGRFHITTPGGGAGVSAMVTPRASCEDRGRAFDLNLQCISSIRGCTELREIMPYVWMDREGFVRLHTLDQAP